MTKDIAPRLPGPTRGLPWYGWGGCAALCAGQIGLALAVPGVRMAFYAIAWWSYILIVDAWTWRRRGESLLRSRPREFWFLAFWSIAVWNLFELLNFRLQNWCYINVPRDPTLALLFNFLSFATVLPAIFGTCDLLSSIPFPARLRTRPVRVSRAILWGSASVGLGMLLAALLWPRYAFPLAWGFAIFLGDPLCYRLGSRTTSLLGQLERGDPRPALRLLLAGLICGGLWEFWNYWAYTKWLYTVPFLEEWKWFEMPPLGFVGFPPFALECYVLVNLLAALRGGRSWETATPPRMRALRGGIVALAVGAMAFNLGVYMGIDRLTVKSVAPRLADLEGIGPAIVDRLAQAGVETPPELLRRTADPGHREALSRKSGLSAADLASAITAARLADLKGLGAANHNALRRLGIFSLEDLARQDPLPLLPRWRAAVTERPPTLPQIRLWIRAARRTSGIA